MRAKAIAFLLALILIARISVPGSVLARPEPLSRGDLRWLARVTFGIDTAAVARFRALGREKFLDEQLRPLSSDPAPVAAAIAALPVTQQTAQTRLAANRTEQQRINSLASEDDKQAARTALNQAGNQAVYETSKRHLIRALESPSQLREQMTWFWMNHFSVFSGKANVRWTLAEYEEQAVRAHALGHFRELVMATALSPAMLEYLDNAQSAAGKINENYARELMELHTLGVSGGPSGSSYTQTDVQELARVLTGVGLNFTDTGPRLSPKLQALYVRGGLFEFNPARHDLGPKTLLGHAIAGQGLGELTDAVALLCRQAATARFISAKLATYFVADDPPPALVERMTHVPKDGRFDRGGAARPVSRPGVDCGAEHRVRHSREVQGPDAIRRLLDAARLLRQGDHELPPGDWVAAAAGRTAIRSRDARRVPVDGSRVVELGATGATVRNRARARQRQRRPVQQPRQHSGTVDRIPPTRLQAVFRCD